MKKQVLFIHGGDSYSNPNDFLSALKTQTIRNPQGVRLNKWTDKLRNDLGNEIELFQPTMPNKDNARYAEWKIWFERHLAYLTGEIVLVGWSLGGMFLQKYLIENSLNISTLFLIASPYAAYDDGEGNDCGSFRFDADKVSSVSAKVGNIHILHSKDDFVVPYEHAEKLKAALPEATLHTFEDRNHFLQEDFPELIDLIKG